MILQYTTCLYLLLDLRSYIFYTIIILSLIITNITLNYTYFSYLDIYLYLSIDIFQFSQYKIDNGYNYKIKEALNQYRVCITTIYTLTDSQDMKRSREYSHVLK